MTYKIKGDRRAEAHPAAEAFPLPEDSAIQTLAENIQRNGLLTTVLLQRIEGRDLVVDGRCRLLACERVDCTPSVRYINPEEDPIEVIVSTNPCRRHQSPSQRALAAARLTTILGPGRPQKIDSLEAISAPRAGEMFGISRSSVGRAKAILKHALLVAAVESGAVTVGAAWEIRETDEEAQRKALEAVATGTTTSLLAALEQNAPKDPDGVASDHAAARRSGRSASGPPGAEPNGALEEESAPSDPPSAASGPSASNGASAAARRPDSGSERAPVSDPSSGTSSHSLRPRATSGDTPGGTAPNMEDTDAADAARPALDAASDLRRSLDDLGHALSRFLSDGDGLPERLRVECRLLRGTAAELRRSLESMDDDSDPVVVDGQQRERRPDRTDAPTPDSDADSETASS